jgi:hypothetical protein
MINLIIILKKSVHFSPWPMHYVARDESLPLLMEQWKLDRVRMLLDAAVKQEIWPGADILAPLGSLKNKDHTVKNKFTFDPNILFI